MKKYVVANWKSHKTTLQATIWFNEVVTFLKNNPRILANTTVIVAVPDVHLKTCLDLVEYSNAHELISVALQNISPFDSGAYTGALSVAMLKNLSSTSKISYGIVGHSERRRYFHENCREVAAKCDRLVDGGITPILCVDDGYIAEQANQLPSNLLSRVVVAYEEASVIGIGTPSSIDRVIEKQKEILHFFGDVPVLYGGSVNAANCAVYLNNLDGTIVGSASLEVQNLISILKKTINVTLVN